MHSNANKKVLKQLKAAVSKLLEEEESELRANVLINWGDSPKDHARNIGFGIAHIRDDERRIRDKEKSQKKLIGDLFKLCDLDSQTQLHILLLAVAKIVFNEGGAPEKWTQLSYYQLGLDVARVAQETGKKSSTAIATELKRQKSFKDKYADLKLDSLRKLVARTKNPIFNPGRKTAKVRIPFCGEPWVPKGVRNSNSLKLLPKPTSKSEMRRERELEDDWIAHYREQISEEGIVWTELLEIAFRNEVTKIARYQARYERQIRLKR